MNACSFLNLLLVDGLRFVCQTARPKKGKQRFADNIGSAAQIRIGLLFEPDSKRLRKACGDDVFSWCSHRFADSV